MNNYYTIEKKYLDLFCEHLHKNMGIFIEEGKRDILATKLSRLMTDAGISDSSEYYHFILSPPITQRQKDLQNDFIDNVTVHKTNFFRENNHFEFIKKHIDEILANSESAKTKGELRIWSSACSTGEEPYTISMLMKEILPNNIRAKILATDISPDSLRKAIVGTYVFGPEDAVPPDYANKYFISTGNQKTVVDEVKNQVTFRLFNLMEQFPFRFPFDIIFCRNVMIYFDRDVQEKLVEKFFNATSDKGFLFIGHSESLIQVKHGYTYFEPTIYRK